MASLNDLDIVYPSPILRDSLRAQKEGASSPLSEPQTPPKRVQFNEKSISPSRPIPSSNLFPSPNLASSPNSSSPKKKKKFFYERDSLKSRYKKGSPGTRRHQRWSNEMYLNHDWSDLSESDAENDDLFEATEENISRPTFSFVEVYEKETEILEDFWYGKAASLDSSHYVQPKSLPPPRRRIPTEPHDRFRRIPKRTRKQIANMNQSVFLRELENDFVNYLTFLHNNHWTSTNQFLAGDEEEEEDCFQPAGIRLEHPTHKFLSTSSSFQCTEKKGKLVLYLQDSHARLITHGVCHYYGFKSESWDDSQTNQRATTVYLPPCSMGVPEVPRLSIQEYLESSECC